MGSNDVSANHVRSARNGYFSFYAEKVKRSGKELCMGKGTYQNANHARSARVVAPAGIEPATTRL